MIQVQPASIELIPSFYESLRTVASEKVYIEMTEPPPLEKVRDFQISLIEKNGPIFYAVDGERVVGWCDVFPEKNPRQNHRGSLGMGLLPSYRGKGIGTQLLSATLARAKEFGLEKVELHVYTSNQAAIALYEKCGFVREGLIRRYRKLNGQVFDCLAMGIFLDAPPGMAQVARVDHVQVSIPKGCEDLARKFYCEFLGLTELEKPEALKARGGFWTALGPLQIHFGVEDGVDRKATKSHIAYEVGDLAAWRKKLVESGIETIEGIGIPGIDRFEFRDPFGNRVEFLERTT